MDFQITAEDVKEALDRGEKLTLVDVREPWEFEVSHLEGAKLIPVGDVPSSKWTAAGASHRT
jgi:rhodanese-related sulfurtransferase